jgi:hypothetical protein
MLRKIILLESTPTLPLEGEGHVDKISLIQTMELFFCDYKVGRSDRVE